MRGRSLDGQVALSCRLGLSLFNTDYSEIAGCELLESSTPLDFIFFFLLKSTIAYKSELL